MVALRLAEHVEHTVDVDGMLDRMTPEQFHEWCLKDEIEPIGHTGQMAAMIAYLMHVYLTGEDDREQFMPWLKHLASENVSDTAVSQLRAQLEKVQ